MKFTMACSKYFGKKDGQTLAGFAEELKQLTDADKAELCAELSQHFGEPVEL